MLFYLPSTSNPSMPMAVALVYVDDFVVAYSDEFQLSSLKNLFEWGLYLEIDGKPVTFKGKEVFAKTGKDRVFILLNQAGFIKNMTSLMACKLKFSHSQNCLQTEMRGPSSESDHWVHPCP